MRKKIRRAVGAVFLALAIAFSQVPASYVEAISAGSDFKMNGDTLISYTGTASVVSVPAGTKVIATDAFAGNSNLSQIQFPSSLKIIENGAFRNCKSIKKVVFPSGLETIESGAFSMCDNLSEVVLSDTITELGAGVFSGDNKLKTIDVLSNSNFIVVNGALYNSDMTKLIQVFAGRKGESYVMPDSVTNIERYAFWGCKNLKSVNLSSNLYEIPEYSFSNCKNLTSISLPYSVRKIAAKAFEDCISMEYIFLPASVTDIHSTAFDGCSQLFIDAQEGTSAYEFAQNFETSIAALMESEGGVSGNTIGDLYKDIFSDKTNYEEEDTSESAVDNEEEATKNTGGNFYDPDKPADVSKLDVGDYYGEDSDDLIGKTRVVGGNAVVLYGNGNSNVSISQGNSMENSEATDAFEPDMVVADNQEHLIAKKSYYQDKNLGRVEIEEGIEKINDFAFSRSSLAEIEIPDSVTHIGYGAFYHCDNLKNVIIPASVKSIEPEAFAKTPYIANWKQGGDTSDFLIVGDGILLAYKGNASQVYLPVNVKKIGAGAFKNHPEITSVYFGSGVTEVGEDAFYGCTSLAKVEGGENLKKICDRAFALCPLLSIHIPKSVTEIGMGAFKLADPDAVVFENENTLPAVSYEKTATRLENDGYRSFVFSDVSTFVIDNYNINLENTIADERYLGFRGVVVTLADEADSVVLVACTALPNENTGLVEVPASVRIDGKNYSVEKALPNAFSAYETYEYWGGEEIKGILLPPSLGKLSDYKSELSFDSADGDGTEATSEKVTTIVLEDNFMNAESVAASVIDDDNRYLLYVDCDVAGDKELKKAVSQKYGSLVEGQLNTLDLIMVEMKSNVPITNFGDTKVEIQIPISDTLMQQDICAVTLSDEGNLQTIYGTKETVGDKNYFKFKTNHFSTYGIYVGIGEIGEKIQAESKKLLEKDKSPDTGEDFNPKWLLVVALGLIGLILIINKPTSFITKKNFRHKI